MYVKTELKSFFFVLCCVLLSARRHILNDLEDHDIISYADGGRTEETRCGKQFSSNWHAGRKGNDFSKTWWENVKYVPLSLRLVHCRWRRVC